MGDLNVVVIAWADTTSQVTAVTDSKGNVYQLAVGPTGATGFATQSIYYAVNIVSAAEGANTVTVSFSAAAPFPDLRIVEYSGISGTAPVDVTAAGTGTGVTADSGTVKTTNADDLLVAGDYVGSTTAAAGTGFTERVLTSPAGDLEEDSRGHRDRPL